MSVTHNIFAKKTLVISELNDFVSTIDNATFEDRGEGIYYYWIDGKSTRGFDITIEGNTIEVRNTILSNKPDYDLTNKVIEMIINLTDGLILNEDEEQVDTLPIFDNDKIIRTELRDCELIQTISKDTEDIAIYGPKRKVHFGKRLHSSFKHYSGEELKEKMFNLIIKVNYQIPNFDNGDIMLVGNSGDDKKIMKLLTNEVDCIIDKYDYILLQISDDKLLMITNESLNKMLPSNWTLVDEFTVIAPMTSKDEWEKLLNAAKHYDQFDTFHT